MAVSLSLYLLSAIEEADIKRVSQLVFEPMEAVRPMLKRLKDFIFGPSIEVGAVFPDEVLGNLIFDADLGWTGKYEFLGQEIDFDVYDIDLEPASTCLIELREWLLNADESAKCLWEFVENELRRQRLSNVVNIKDFRITSVSGFRSDCPGFMLVWLEHPEDPFKAWRVTYDSGKPKYLGFDN